MSYTKTNWTNNTGEKINATNLNKIENELEYLDDNQTVINDEYSTSPTETYSSNYINGIIDSGTGYIKFNDGTMICYGEKSGTASLTEYWTYNKRTGDISVDYAQEFISKPVINLTPSSQGITSVVNVSHDKTTVTFWVIKAAATNDTNYSVWYTAIGKWK